MERSALAQRLRGGLFLSAMMGRTNGEFVAQHGKGAAMVQIGALVADLEDRTHEPIYLLPAEEDDMVTVLRKEVTTIRRALGDVPIGLNAAPGELESAVRMARAFQRAGGDIFELNVHGAYDKLLGRGLLRAMALPENRPKMLAWLRRLCELEIPITVKFNGRMEGVDFVEVLAELSKVGELFGVHFNVRTAGGTEPNLELVRRVRPHTRGILFCSGRVKSAGQARALFQAGCDCVGVAQGVLDEPGILARLSAELGR